MNESPTGVSLVEETPPSKVRYFRHAGVGASGEVEGVDEYSPTERPEEHIRLDYDELGRVRRMEIYDRERGEPQPGCIREFYYIEEGKQVSESAWYDRYGNLSSVHRYFYDREGMLQERRAHEPDGTLVVCIGTKYDGEGHLLEESTYEKGQLTKLQRFRYDDEGRQIEDARYESEGEEGLIGTWRNEYNEEGRQSKRSWYTKRGDLSIYYCYEYDAAGRPLRVEMYNADDERQSTIEYRYDERGDLVEDRHYDKGGLLLKRNLYTS